MLKPVHVSGWDDTSEFITHFTKDGDSSDALNNFLSILGNQRLIAKNVFGMKRHPLNPKKTVCFSEIPPDQLRKMIVRRSLYGIGFRKSYAAGRGINPIWYVEKDGALYAAIRCLAERAEQNCAVADDPVWSILPFIDAPGIYNDREYRFEWEREWRHVGDFHFLSDDVVFIVMPESEHAITSNFLADMNGPIEESGFPPYNCPYIDPMWDKKRILDALNGKLQF